MNWLDTPKAGKTERQKNAFSVFLEPFNFQIVHIRKSPVSEKSFAIPSQHAETNRVSKGGYTEPVPAAPFGRRRQFDFLDNFKIELL